MYKVKLTTSEEQIRNLKAKGMYPFPKGGYEFFVDTVIEVSDLSIFNESEKSKALDPRLTAEETNEVTEETDVK